MALIERDYSAPGVSGFAARPLGVAVLGIAGLIAGFFVDRDHFFISYLVGFLFWLNIALGMLGLLMVQHLSGGAWGIVLRRIFEAGVRTLPFMGILFIPVVLGIHSLYEWSHADAVAADPLLQHKAPYLNQSSWIMRAVIYFVIWTIMGFLLSAWSSGQDRTGDPSYGKRMAYLSGPGIVVFGLTVTFMSVDWFMSLEPHWFSTMYPVLFVVSEGLAALCFSLVVLVWLSNRQPMAQVVNPAHIHDIGKLMTAFVMLWAYTNFSQYLIIWSGNLAEEAPWYLRRTNDLWRLVPGLLILFHFAIPFMLLLSRDLKRTPRALATVALFLLVMRVVDIFWFLRPAVAAHGELKEGHGSLLSALSTAWIDASALLAIGGIWLFLFFTMLGRRPVMPAREPYLEEALAHGGGH